MQFYYAEKNILRALDEAEFWKHQEAEHTTVILLVTPGLEIGYVRKLKDFEKLFNSIYGNLVRCVESAVRSGGMLDAEMKREMTEWIAYSIDQSRSFVKFLEKILDQSEAVQKSVPAQTVINHIIRESQYFIGIDSLIVY